MGEVRTSINMYPSDLETSTLNSSFDGNKAYLDKNYENQQEMVEDINYRKNLLNRYISEMHDLEKQSKNLLSTIQDFQTKQHSKEEDIIEYQEVIDNIESQLRNNSDKMASLSEELQKQVTTVKNIESQWNQSNDKLNMTNIEISKLDKELYNKQKEINQEKDTLNALKSDRESAINVNNNKEGVLQKSVEKFRGDQEKLNSLRNNKSQREKEIAEITKELTKLKGEMSDKEELDRQATLLTSSSLPAQASRDAKILILKASKSVYQITWQDLQTKNAYLKNEASQTLVSLFGDDLRELVCDCMEREKSIQLLRGILQYLKDAFGHALNVSTSRSEARIQGYKLLGFNIIADDNTEELFVDNIIADDNTEELFVDNIRSEDINSYKDFERYGKQIIDEQDSISKKASEISDNCGPYSEMTYEQRKEKYSYHKYCQTMALKLLKMIDDKRNNIDIDQQEYSQLQQDIDTLAQKNLATSATTGMLREHSNIALLKEKAQVVSIHQFAYGFLQEHTEGIKKHKELIEKGEQIEKHLTRLHTRANNLRQSHFKLERLYLSKLEAALLSYENETNSLDANIEKYFKKISLTYIKEKNKEEIKELEDNIEYKSSILSKNRLELDQTFKEIENTWLELQQDHRSWQITEGKTQRIAKTLSTFSKSITMSENRIRTLLDDLEQIKKRENNLRKVQESQKELNKNNKRNLEQAKLQKKQIELHISILEAKNTQLEAEKRSQVNTIKQLQQEITFVKKKVDEAKQQQYQTERRTKLLSSDISQTRKAVERLTTNVNAAIFQFERVQEQNKSVMHEKGSIEQSQTADNMSIMTKEINEIRQQAKLNKKRQEQE